MTDNRSNRALANVDAEKVADCPILAVVCLLLQRWTHLQTVDLLAIGKPSHYRSQMLRDSHRLIVNLVSGPDLL